MSTGLACVKTCKGWNSPGFHYIHCVTCNYHFTFPKSASPHPLPEPFSTATHDGLAALHSHRFDQLSSKQQGKLAVSTVPASLNVMTTPDPLVIFPEQEKQRTKAECVQSLQSQQLEDDEDGHYQAAIAASLAVPHNTPHIISSASSSPGPLKSFAPSAPSPSSLLLAHPSVFSMTPVVPLLQPSTKPTTADGKAPKQQAIHECPLWKKLTCLSLDEHIQQATTKDTHLRYNITAEHTGIKKQLQQKKIAPPHYLIQYVSDNDDEHEELEDDADANPQPLQCQHSNLESATSTPLHQPLSPFSPSPTSSPMASPCPILPNTPIHVPETSKQWPAGMYAIDMSLGFHQVNQLKTLLDESLFTVFGKKILPNTYHDQWQYWMALTQEQRDNFKNAGRTPAGLWSVVPKRSKGHLN
ncbi:hypothetical protein K443DRAFT_638418 [Laccaria amethystina LaAM-08-1]|uniref:Uncharacterized protein n=1 Tax=Laccaria amethystina LaAM-08-1 TaxID=1095629 RepID=A0A0C9WJZ9_9AGAR|nr:hypothetical protein K443DRAFT_638418 [Laccaria amethystina LaAM-08-1]